jgi:uncharacterized membrane protein YphA (DoxX/SURF4 family)
VSGARPPTGWAGGRRRGWAGATPLVGPEQDAPPRENVRREDAPPGTAPPGAGEGAPAGGLRAAGELAAQITAEWAPTAGRMLLGFVFAWFGYHELLFPGQWTQYVPVISESSTLAIILVLAHGWVLLVLASALVSGIAPRVSAAIASVLMLEIVISLAVTGLSDTAVRDVGVLGLALCLTGCRNQRLLLRG